MAGKRASKKKDLLKVVFLLLALEILLIFAVIFIIFVSIGSDAPEDAVNKVDFSTVLNDSIKIYGTEFTGALSVYLAEYNSFTDYKRENFKHSRNEITKLIEEKDLKLQKNIFESFFGGIVKEDDKKRTYYNWYFPIADGYKANYSDGWGDARSNGDGKHKGTDLMCDEGTPIVAIESGNITGIGWNELGGWRIGITSENEQRYWYYGHMRKVHPYVRSLKKGDKIEGGQVIGYVGSTGESDKLSDDTMPENENAVDGKFDAHLHMGVYKKILDNIVAYNPFPILEVVKNNKVMVELSGDEYIAKPKSIDERLVQMANISISEGLGGLSGKYESSSNPGTIANNSGDPGGKSYGAFQLASKRGSLNSFLMWLSTQDINLYNRLMSAKDKDGGYGATFDSEWKQIANEQPEYFYSLQYNYIKVMYFDQVVVYFKERGFDIESRSKTLQSVVWSTAVQHGVGGAIGIIGKQNLNGTDREIIIGIYSERMKVDIYFYSSSLEIRQSVYNRFENELIDALAMLEAETGG